MKLWADVTMLINSAGKWASLIHQVSDRLIKCGQKFYMISRLCNNACTELT